MPQGHTLRCNQHEGAEMATKGQKRAKKGAQKGKVGPRRGKACLTGAVTGASKGCPR